MHWSEEISAFLAGKVLLVAFSAESVLPRHKIGFVKAMKKCPIFSVGTAYSLTSAMNRILKLILELILKLILRWVCRYSVLSWC